MNGAHRTPGLWPHALAGTSDGGARPMARPGNQGFPVSPPAHPACDNLSQAAVKAANSHQGSPALLLDANFAPIHPMHGRAHVCRARTVLD